MINTKLHTTAGVKDYLPAECALKNEVEAKIKAVFDSYNYKCVITPTFEYIEVYDGMGGVDSKRMYKFLDRDGSILALRPDVTPAIARVAATAYDKTDLPLRFSYVGNAFRYNESYQGKLREFTQAGVELIGVNSIEADAEALIIAINSLLAVGLEDFRVDIANVDFLKGVLEEARLDDELSEAVTDAVVNKNYVEVVKLTEELDITDKLKTLFNDLPLLIGDISVLDTAKTLVNNAKSIDAIEYMRKLYEILEGCGYAKYVSFDLSVTGHFDYYTGIVFRAYARGTGFSVIDGGRYDKLVGNYGEAYPAVGLAVKINDIMSVMKPKEVASADVLVAYTDDGALMALRMADELRKSGKKAELSLLGSDIDKNKAYALKNNIGTMLYINGKECRTMFVRETE
jgi:ATP phosphoribosyltransferase regulatory subunit